MITFARPWFTVIATHARFLAMLPSIRERAQLAFRVAETLAMGGQWARWPGMFRLPADRISQLRR